jgi:hypothetical protein
MDVGSNERAEIRWMQLDRLLEFFEEEHGCASCDRLGDTVGRVRVAFARVWVKGTRLRVEGDEKGKVSARVLSYYATLLSYCSRGCDGLLRASMPTRAWVRDCCSQRPVPHEAALQSMRKLPECVRLFFEREYTAVAKVRGDV